MTHENEAAIDAARAVREGEELDAAKLGAYLGAPVTAVQQFPSGHSNLTYLVTLGDRELVLRRPPFGTTVKSAHDMGREFKILSHLSPVFPRAPRPVASCDDASVIGAPFYVMERIRGVVIRRTLPKGMTLSPAQLRALSFALVDVLAELHAVDYRAIGLGDLGKPDGYVTRQVTGWTKRWHDSKTDEVPDVDVVAAWLAAHPPRESGAALIHNDYKLDNVLLDAADPTRIVGVLDWEMSTIGDPRMDLGTFLGYWLQQGDDPRLAALAFGPTDREGAPTRSELLARYVERTGRDVGDMRFHYVFAIWKTAIVLQQIYFRWVKGLTQDERFGMLGMAMKVLAENARRVADGGTY